MRSSTCHCCMQRRGRTARLSSDRSIFYFFLLCSLSERMWRTLDFDERAKSSRCLILCFGNSNVVLLLIWIRFVLLEARVHLQNATALQSARLQWFFVVLAAFLIDFFALLSFRISSSFAEIEFDNSTISAVLLCCFTEIRLLSFQALFFLTCKIS